MTRTEIQQVRDALNQIGEYVDRAHVLLPTSLHKAEAMGECASAAAALEILDAKLALPEALEWGVRAAGGLLAGPISERSARESLRDFTRHAPDCVLVVRTAESRTPAGPWEAA